jgi:hypothetical protein
MTEWMLRRRANHSSLTKQKMTAVGRSLTPARSPNLCVVDECHERNFSLRFSTASYCTIIV